MLSPLNLPAEPPALYSLETIHEIHLRLAPDQYAALDPMRGAQGFGFGPPGGGLFGGGAGRMVAPIVVRAGDTDYDGALSKREFSTLAESWFSAWDAKRQGKISQKEFLATASATLKPPPMSLQAPEGKRNGVVGMLGMEFKYVHGEIDINGTSFKDVAVRYKGNGTFLGAMNSPKKPFKIDLNKYVKDQSLPGGVHTLNLHNSVADPSGMNDALAHRFFRDSGVPSPRTGYAKVYLTVHGQQEKRYLGLYEIVEDIGSAFLAKNFGSDKGGLFKPSTPEMFAYRGEDWKRYNQTYEPRGASDEDKKRLIALCRLVTKGTDAEFGAKIGDFIDLPSVALYFAALVCVTDLDGILGPGQNLYLYAHPEDKKLRFIPWDYDQSWGQFGMRGTQEQREQLRIDRPWQDTNRFLERLFKTPAFQKLYRAELTRLSKTLFLPERIAGQVDALAPVLRAPIKEESEERLSRFERSVAGKPLPPPGPFSFGETKPIKLFLPLRARSIQDQLAGKSQGLTLSPFMGFGPPVGQMIGPGLWKALDADADGTLTREETKARFAAWFAAWSDGKPTLSEEALVAGLNKVLPPPQMPGLGGFRPPGGGE